MIKVILVDDHHLLRQGLKGLLADSDQVTVVGDASDIVSARKLISLEKPDIILMDISLGEKESGIDFTEELTKKYKSIKIIALSMHKESSIIKSILKKGAKGYLLKDSTSDQLIEAIVKVHGGEVFYTDEIKEIVMNSLLSQEKGNTPRLSMREKDVLSLIIKELTTNEIAEKLFISSGTVETHRRNMISKLGVRNTAGLVRTAMEKGILED